MLPAGTTPPALVTNFAASDGEDCQSALTWTNPGDTDLAEVLVKRNTGSYPTDHTTGATVFNNTSPTAGANVTYTDTGLTNGTTYYYAVFSKDADGNWNDTVQAGSNADTGTPSTGDGPVGYWKLDEGSGSVAGDSSGLGNDGTIHGASWVNGSPDGSTALSFDGASDHVDVPSDASLTFSGAFTVEAWIDPTSTSDVHRIVSQDGASSGDNHFILMLKEGVVKFSCYTNAWHGMMGSTILSAGRWYHVAGVYTGSELRIYVDGVLDGSLNVSGAVGQGQSAQETVIGAKVNVTQVFDGKIDEVRIYNRALDSSEFNLLPAGYHPSAVNTRELLDSPLCRPNPVRSAPATFVVDNSSVTQISVSIYDLSGMRVYESDWVVGNSVEWDLMNDYGKLLANGVYLYIVRVKDISGHERQSKPKVLAILR